MKHNGMTLTDEQVAIIYNCRYCKAKRNEPCVKTTSSDKNLTGCHPIRKKNAKVVAYRAIRDGSCNSLEDLVEKSLNGMRFFLHTKKKSQENKIILTPKVKKIKSVIDEFYNSWKWKEVRYLALQRDGRKCLCCGWEPHMGGTYLVVDHIKSRKIFPKYELLLDNLQVLCNDCNMGKTWKYSENFRESQ